MDLKRNVKAAVVAALKQHLGEQSVSVDALICLTWDSGEETTVKIHETLEIMGGDGNAETVTNGERVRPDDRLNEVVETSATPPTGTHFLRTLTHVTQSSDSQLM